MASSPALSAAPSPAAAGQAEARRCCRLLEPTSETKHEYSPGYKLQFGHGTWLYIDIRFASIQLKNSEQDLFQISDNVSVSCSLTHCAFLQGEIIEARPGRVGRPAKSS